MVLLPEVENRGSGLQVIDSLRVKDGAQGAGQRGRNGGVKVCLVTRRVQESEARGKG